jgi:predicted transcriptional regulator
LANQIWFGESPPDLSTWQEAVVARPPTKDLTERELEVMHVFWRHGEQTASEARDRLAVAGLDRAYPTVANLVRLLHEKGFLEQTASERPFRYRPACSYEDVSGRLLGDVLERVFRGSREQLLLRLVERRKLTAKERAVLEAVLKEQDA